MLARHGGRVCVRARKVHVATDSHPLPLPLLAFLAFVVLDLAVLLVTLCSHDAHESLLALVALTHEPLIDVRIGVAVIILLAHHRVRVFRPVFRPVRRTVEVGVGERSWGVSAMGAGDGKRVVRIENDKEPHNGEHARRIALR